MFEYKTPSTCKNMPLCGYRTHELWFLSDALTQTAANNKRFLRLLHRTTEISIFPFSKSKFYSFCSEAILSFLNSAKLTNFFIGTIRCVLQALFWHQATWMAFRGWEKPYGALGVWDTVHLECAGLAESFPADLAFEWLLFGVDETEVNSRFIFIC